ncbi:hypothetical protein GCM10007897_41420 [Sphingobium jiangsuense]|uniref:DUF6950 domain-containing protein n=1 Tax=Sphingobium jiangsuense TaxID=870476 RepID=A0A7W6BQA3_9SPHN|nr:hypothetical protein [Sphingobium jiangsuense]MBB3927817.1 hypothetical protein [Sphingobium jiangsuense]GLT02720.1 hypothetical protein GCM10007897_41420 [Sphingobium jiangsuense]
MADMAAFLLHAGQRRRVPNEWDCCAMPAAWAMECGWPDPMKYWRGAYSTEEMGLAFIKDAGGLVALFDCGMASAGIPRVDGEPMEGDIGVLSVGEHQAGAVFTGKRWAMVADRGLAVASIDPACVLALWRVAHG